MRRRLRETPLRRASRRRASRRPHVPGRRTGETIVIVQLGSPSRHDCRSLLTGIGRGSFRLASGPLSISVVAAGAVCQDPAVIAVQELRSEDWAIWRALRIEATTAEPEAFGSTLAEVLATTETQWRARLSKESLYLVAHRGDDAVGMAAVNDEFELGSVWVRPHARGSGAGHRLVDAALRWAASHGAPSVRLAVRETNAAAIGLYRAHGFIEVGDDYLNPERVHRLILMAHETTTAPCRVRPLDP